MKDYAPFTFLMGWALVAPYLGSRFVFSMDMFWKNMFLRLRGANTSFNHAFVEFEITFLP
jgi:hypothetical protein